MTNQAQYEFIKDVPELIKNKAKDYKVLYYQNALYSIQAMLDNIKDTADKGMARKDIALKIKDNSYKTYGFKAIDDNIWDAETLVKKYGYKMFVKTLERK